jgi:hypothetical protein
MNSSKNPNHTTYDVTKAAHGDTVAIGLFWLCKDGDPTQAIFYKGEPQGNKDVLVSNRFVGMVRRETGWPVEVIQIELAFKPQRKFIK